MARRVYPTVAEALEIHRRLIAEFGGGDGLRDLGRLEAAILRPQTGYYEDLFDEAASLMESLANNHAFLDGNKRISLALTDVFLRMNGQYLEVGAPTAYKFIMSAMQRGEFHFGLIRQWIRSYARPLSSSG